MKNISIVLLVLLTSCNALFNHKEDLKPIAHDMIDEGIDQTLGTENEEQ